MISVLQTAAVIIIALTGIVTGILISRTRGKLKSLSGYTLSFVCVLSVLAFRAFPALEFRFPFNWVAGGRIPFVLLAFSTAMGLANILPHLQHRWQKYITAMVITILLPWFTITPFLVPELMRYRHAALTTNQDSTGICYQSTRYTCGPAAAVTALNRLGLKAYEGEIAVRANTVPFLGTSPACLTGALNSLYRKQGIECRYRYLDSVDSISDSEIMLAVISENIFERHCVAVIDSDRNSVTIADPALGKMRLSSNYFHRIWNKSGIILSRTDRNT